MTTSTAEEARSSYEVTHHLCAHRRSECDRCPRCFHGWHRCGWCWPSRSGLPAKPRRRRPRCAACGRFRSPKTGPECDRCAVRGFVALTLF